MQFRKLAAAVATLLVPAAIAALGATSASATAVPTSVTAVTHVVDRPDSGNGGTWAYDSFNRTLSVSVAAVQVPADTSAGLTDYVATVSDHGSFAAIVGADTPNQAVPGLKVKHSATGSFAGNYAFTITAPSADTLTGVVPKFENDAFGPPVVTTGDWPRQAFATTTGVILTPGAWSWSYSTACEQWTDSSGNGYGNLPADGNITGKYCAAPHVYDVSTRYVAATRELFSFRSTQDGYVKVLISGPGPISGHTWLIAVHGGALNSGVITGLTYHRDYTLIFTPATSSGHQVPGSHSVVAGFLS